MRACWTAGLAVIGLAVAAGPAMPVAQVQLVTSQTELEVEVTSERSTPHRMIIEPFFDGGRFGWRVRQATAGQPAFTSQDPDCFVNGLVNDVVCSIDGDARIGEEPLRRGDVGVTTGLAGDAVTIRELRPDPAGTSCVVVFPQVRTASLDLGSGDDDLRVITRPDPCPAGSLDINEEPMRVVAQGGPGRDDLRGGAHDDDLAGGSSRDVLDGKGGADTLAGGSANDDLVSLDGIRDTAIDCGSGALDELLADRADLPLFSGPGLAPIGGAVLQFPRGCEERTFTGAGEGLPARLLTTDVRLRLDGTVRIGIECPLGSGRRCAGNLRIARGVPGALGTVVATGRYSVDLGERRFFSVALPGMRRGATLEVRLRELPGPRLSFRPLTVR